MGRSNAYGYPLPTPIGNERIFTWGKVIKVHDFGALDIKVVEFEDTFDGQFKISYSIYVRDVACGMHCPSLEQAVIYGISYRHLGPDKTFNGNYPFFACKILELN